MTFGIKMNGPKPVTKNTRVSGWEMTVAIGVIGSMIAIGLAVMSPLQNDWKGWGHYLFGLLVMPLPFIVLAVIGIIGFRRADKNAN